MGKYGIGTHATTIKPSPAQDGYTEVTYHHTAVVSYNDSHITLNSGGFRTVTTKRRMNEVATALSLGFRVYQVRGDWFVSFGDDDKIPFEDNMVLVRKYPTFPR